MELFIDSNFLGHFICFSLDPEQKECLIEVIEKLLKDKTTVSAVHEQLINKMNHHHSSSLCRRTHRVTVHVCILYWDVPFHGLAGVFELNSGTNNLENSSNCSNALWFPFSSIPKY